MSVYIPNFYQEFHEKTDAIILPNDGRTYEAARGGELPSDIGIAAHVLDNPAIVGFQG